jgi:LmbE family N-acetylglucosaminyl deacetylase
MSRRVLVLAPHPDDETLGCGGAILLHRAQGHAVKVVFVTDGAAGDPRGYYRGRDYVRLREREAERAARVLGVRSLEFWRCPDRGLGRVRGLADRLAKLLREESPDIVYLPSRSDRHPDHRRLAAACRRLSLPAAWDYETDMMPRPTRVVDITRQFKRKLRALREYRSQLRYRDYAAAIERLNTLRSMFLEGCGYAEAFRATGITPG